MWTKPILLSSFRVRVSSSSVIVVSRLSVLGLVFFLMFLCFLLDILQSKHNSIVKCSQDPLRRREGVLPKVFIRSLRIFISSGFRFIHFLPNGRLVDLLGDVHGLRGDRYLHNIPIGQSNFQIRTRHVPVHGGLSEPLEIVHVTGCELLELNVFEFKEANGFQ